MYAVIKTGGKQYRVSSGEKVKVEQMAAEVGSQITIDQVLMVADGDKITIGTPLVKGAKVQATVVDQGRADKIHVFKMRRRKQSKKQQGHRQNYTEIQVDQIAV
jgi:large subunit ribosomal protein L21